MVNIHNVGLKAWLAWLRVQELKVEFMTWVTLAKGARRIERGIHDLGYPLKEREGCQRCYGEPINNKPCVFHELNDNKVFFGREASKKGLVSNS